MKLNNYTYYFSLALLCASTLFSAASSSDQSDQAHRALHDDRENGQAAETMATLEERYQTAQQVQIAPEISSEQTSVSDDRERKRVEHPEKPEQSTKKQQTLRAHMDQVTLQTNDGSNENIPLTNARAYSGLLKDLTDEYTSEPITIDLPVAYSKTSLKLIADLLRSRSTYTTAQKIYDANLKALPPTQLDTIFVLISLADYLQLDTVIMGALVKLLERDHLFNDAAIIDFLQSVSIEKVIEQMAKDHFLKLAPKAEGRKPELLPVLLRTYFTGISIQDLILKNEIPPFQIIHRTPPPSTRVLNLSRLRINDLNGLTDIPDIQKADTIDLGYNLIKKIEPGTFSDLPNLQLLVLTGNPISYDFEQRRRIKEEIEFATNGKGHIKWD